MTRHISRALAIALCGCLVATSAAAQQYAYPAKGQSAEQQKKDEAECATWATGQTGVDPSKPSTTQAPPPPPTTATGVTPGAGARGAARGAVVGGIAGDSGAGAAAGAAAARGQSRRQNSQQQQQASQQQQQAQGSQNAAYAKARAACLEGRGYTVK